MTVKATRGLLFLLIVFILLARQDQKASCIKQRPQNEQNKKLVLCFIVSGTLLGGQCNCGILWYEAKQHYSVHVSNILHSRMTCDACFANCGVTPFCMPTSAVR